MGLLVAISFTPISIHAPREGCDMATFIPRLDSNDFNPRTP